MNFEINIFGIKINKKQIINFVKFMSKVGLILLILGSMFLLNHSILLSPDDYNYTFVQGSNLTQRVDSIKNCIQTAKFFYNNWTGRVIPHVLVGIFRNLNPLVFEIVNSLVFIIFIITITKVLNKKSTFLGLLSVFGYLSFSMMFGEKFAWISGSCNYLWSSTFLVIFIYFVYNYFNEKINLNICYKILLILYSFIVGFCHENTAFVGGAFLVCLFLFNIKKFLKFDNKKKITTILIFIMFCLGAFATIFAPGNFKRVEETDTTFSWLFLKNYLDNIYVLITVIVSIIIIFILNNIEIIKREKTKCLNPLNWKKFNYGIVKEELLFFILPALIATIPMAVISYFPPRAFLSYEVMFMIVFSKNVCFIAEYFKKYEKTMAVISIILTLFVFGKFSPSTLGQINYIIPYKTKVTSQYEEAKEKGEKDVVVSKFEYGQWIHADDWINVANFFPEFDYHMPVNALISMYYGFDRITAVRDDEYLIEITVDTEGLNNYDVIDIETGKNVGKYEYDNVIRYSIPKEKIGKFLLDGRKNNLKNLVLDYKVRYVGGQLSKDEIKLDDLLLNN